MKAVVTGGAGFIGSHVVDLLINEGHTVSTVDNLSTGRRENLNPRAEFLGGDITDEVFLQKALTGAEVVFHLAALPRIQPSFEDPLLHEKVNVEGAVKVFLAAKQNGVRKIVFSSSSSVYGTPQITPTPETAPIDCLSPYALQKYSAEQYLLILGERFGVEVVALRYYNVYGPRSFNEKDPFNAYSSVIGIFGNQKKENKNITITGTGKQRRDFVHVTDVARANLLAALSPVKRGVYNVGTGRCYTINEIATCFEHPTTYIPERKGEADVTWADIQKIRKELNWEPQVSLKQGIQLL